MFYVYQYLREEGTPYYVGKGKGKRAFVKGKHERIKKPSNLNNIIIVKDNLTETEAFKLETQLIEQYGRKDLGTGILQNLSNGGDGPSGAVYGPIPEERRKKISEKLTGRKVSDETKQKLSLSHKGLKQSDETKKKRSEKLKGIEKSIEYKEHLSKSRMGENNPMFGKISPNKGKKLSDEIKNKIKEARSKQTFSEETRLKMAESQRLRHANKHNL